MRDLRPLVQLLHVAGLHLAFGAARELGPLRALARAQGLGGLLRMPWPHDALALLALERSLEALGPGDPVWRRSPTWLLASGPRTARGDGASQVDAAERCLGLADSAGSSASSALPGPEDDAGEGLLRWWFPAAQPAPPLRLRAPTEGVELQLFSLEEAGDAARLPAHYAASQPARCPAVRLLLCTRAPAALPPGTHLALARHAGAATDGVPRWSIAPTLQLDPEGERDPWPQQLQCLRAYYSPSRPGRVYLERRVLGRRWGAGPFVPTLAEPEGAELAGDTVSRWPT